MNYLQHKSGLGVRLRRHIKCLRRRNECSDRNITK
jgi:hypothetical protein